MKKFIDQSNKVEKNKNELKQPKQNKIKQQQNTIKLTKATKILGSFQIQHFTQKYTRKDCFRVKLAICSPHPKETDLGYSSVYALLSLVNE